MDTVERAYTTKEVSITLDIGTSTLRKWCLALEENGYRFDRTDTNKRLFVERDLVTLKHYKILVQDQNFTMDNAAMVVTARFRDEASESRTPTVLPEIKEKYSDLMHSDEVVQKLINHIQRQEEYMEKQETFNQALLERLEKQEQYIESRLKERDQTLLESLREVQETKKLVASTQEEKKGFFAKLFSR